MSGPGGPLPQERPSDVEAVLLVGEDTLILDRPRYHGDPARVVPIAGARGPDPAARRGPAGGGGRNQPGIGRGRLTVAQVEAMNLRVEQLLGPMETWRYCPHAPSAGWACHTPAPGLVMAAAADLGVAPDRVVVIGDIGSDMEAANAAGALGTLAPSPRTLMDEVVGAPLVGESLGEAGVPA